MAVKEKFQIDPNASVVLRTDGGVRTVYKAGHEDELAEALDKGQYDYLVQKGTLKEPGAASKPKSAKTGQAKEDKAPDAKATGK